MARHKLAKSKIDRLPCGIHGDGDGLFLRVRRSGSRQWIFIYKRDRRRFEMGLGGTQGTAPVSIDLAREKAQTIRERLARGIDPRAEKHPAARIVTFKHCADQLLAAKRGEWTNPKHAGQWVSTLNDYAKPLHDLDVATIVMGDVKNCLLPHWQERQTTAMRLRARIQAVFDYAIAHEWRTAGNPARWRGLLDKVMPKPVKSGNHHAALHYDQVGAMMKNLRASSSISARAVELLALTACRLGEVRGARFDEVDIAAKIWTVPAERMKAGREHVVPLSDRAIDIIQAMKQQSTCDLIFPGARYNTAISESTMKQALRRASPDKTATLHGLRSSFRDWAGDRTEFKREVIEACLAHAVGNETERAYRRNDALEKRREVMTAWAKFCQTPLKGVRS